MSRSTLVVALTGAHGTGKTTLLHALSTKLEEGGYTVRQLSEAPRDIAAQVADSAFFRRDNNNLNRQMLIILKHIQAELFGILDDCDIILTDRTIIDHYCYTKYLFPDWYLNIESQVLDWILQNHIGFYRCIFGLRPEFQPYDDGIRESDPKFQLALDQLIFETYQTIGASPTIVWGSVENRSRMALEVIHSLLRGE